MPRTNKKHRHEAKRKAKRLAERRRHAISPLKRLAEAAGEIECWMSDQFGSLRQMQLFVYKRAGSLSGVACFLVDRGVVGLKDAWTQTGIDRAKFEEILTASRARGIAMRRATIEEVRRWVAGGLRWAHDNGMRLPKDWVKTASLIGGVGDWSTVDVSAFEKEFAGHPEDLRQRLVGEPIESYLKRTDIHFIFDTRAPYMDPDTGRYSDWADDQDDDELDEELDDELDDDQLEAIAAELPDEEIAALQERLSVAAEALAAQTRQWLAERNQAPSPQLVEAWKSVAFSRLLSKAAMPDADEESRADFGFELLKKTGRVIKEAQHPEYDRAIAQCLEHLQIDPQMMQKAVLPPGPSNER